MLTLKEQFINELKDYSEDYSVYLTSDLTEEFLGRNDAQTMMWVLTNMDDDLRGSPYHGEEPKLFDGWRFEKNKITTVEFIEKRGGKL